MIFADSSSVMPAALGDVGAQVAAELPRSKIREV